MAWLEIPTRADIPAYQFSIQLESKTYVLGFTYNDLMQRWFLRIADSYNNTLVSQIPIAVNWPLLTRFKKSGLPPGKFLAYDTSGKGQEATKFDLGDRVRLYYRESTT